MAIGTILSHDEQMKRIARGREATVVAGMLKPIVDRHVDQTISRLVSAYRSDEMSHDFLVGGIAEISALTGMMQELERMHKQGIAVMEQATNGQD